MNRKFIPSLSGLVLAGGRSQRMKTDKSVLEYHGKPQREYLYELLKGFCTTVSVSCRREQTDEISSHINVIPDSFIDMGPMGGLLSAFKYNPDTAWIAVACDLPLLSSESLEYLVENRKPSKMATAFNRPASTFPEPLITIWEPKSYPILLHFLNSGFTSLRKILIKSDIELLEIQDSRELMNVNRPEEYKEVLNTLNIPEE